MTDYLAIELNNKIIYLLAEKGIYFPHTQTLVLADLHLGKAVHFRKSGIMIPSQAGTKQDYQVLQQLILKYQPLRILFLGDLFHSVANNSWDHFTAFANHYKTLNFVLIKGNHDLLPSTLYKEAGLTVYDDLEEDGFMFSHAPLKQLSKHVINIAGHVHPAARLRGLAKQTLKLPCFHLALPYLLLPAFGSLTGLFVLSKENAQQYVIAGKTVHVI